MVSANGWQFHCEIFGNGPDLVFVHGEIHGIEYWKHQIEEFSKHYRCLVYYRRGHSLTGAPAYGYSLTNQRRDLEALITHFDIRHPIIVSVAFGTTIAVDFALHNSKQVKGIVMVAWSELHEAMLYFDRWVKANKVVVNILETQSRKALIDYLRIEGGRSIYMVIPLNSPIREECIQMMASHPVEEYKRGMLELASSVPNLIGPFRKLTIPVLGVCGELDPFPDKPEVLDGMPGFREAKSIPGAGRFVQWEKPQELNAILREFFNECVETD